MQIINISSHASVQPEYVNKRNSLKYSNRENHCAYTDQQEV